MTARQVQMPGKKTFFEVHFRDEDGNLLSKSTGCIPRVPGYGDLINEIEALRHFRKIRTDTGYGIVMFEMQWPIGMPVSFENEHGYEGGLAKMGKMHKGWTGFVKLEVIMGPADALIIVISLCSAVL